MGCVDAEHYTFFGCNYNSDSIVDNSLGNDFLDYLEFIILNHAVCALKFTIWITTIISEELRSIVFIINLHVSASKISNTDHLIMPWQFLHVFITHSN